MEECVKEINDFFQEWRGSRVRFWKYTASHDRFSLMLSNQKKTESEKEITFIFCTYIQGPTQWDNCTLECHLYEDEEGNIGFTVEDKKVGFSLIGVGEIIVANGELNCFFG